MLLFFNEMFPFESIVRGSLEITRWDATSPLLKVLRLLGGMPRRPCSLSSLAKAVAPQGQISVRFRMALIRRKKSLRQV